MCKRKPMPNQVRRKGREAKERRKGREAKGRRKRRVAHISKFSSKLGHFPSWGTRLLGSGEVGFYSIHFGLFRISFLIYPMNHPNASSF
jgi:hypothetical protein